MSRKEQFLFSKLKDFSRLKLNCTLATKITKTIEHDNLINLDSDKNGNLIRNTLKS